MTFTDELRKPAIVITTESRGMGWSTTAFFTRFQRAEAATYARLHRAKNRKVTITHLDRGQ